MLKSEYKVSGTYLSGRKFNSTCVASNINEAYNLYDVRFHITAIKAVNDMPENANVEITDISSPSDEEHEVWSILDKSKYDGKEIYEIEQTFYFIELLIKKVGRLTANQLYIKLHKYPIETIRILDRLTDKEEK